MWLLISDCWYRSPILIPKWPYPIRYSPFRILLRTLNLSADLMKCMVSVACKLRSNDILFTAIHGMVCSPPIPNLTLGLLYNIQLEPLWSPVPIACCREASPHWLVSVGLKKRDLAIKQKFNSSVFHQYEFNTIWPWTKRGEFTHPECVSCCVHGLTLDKVDDSLYSGACM